MIFSENSKDLIGFCGWVFAASFLSWLIFTLSNFPVTKDQALQKIKNYCSFQERCHREVKDKLYGFGLWKQDVETLISQLIEENYLNEERFAQLFARGKFRLKQWGRVKIRHELKQKQISEYCIKMGLKEINEDDYNKTLQKLAAAKWKTLKAEKNMYVKKGKTMAFLLQKGFEPALSTEAVALLCGNKL